MKDYKQVLNSVWQKLQKHGKSIGQKTVYSVLLMFYAFRQRRIPLYARSIVYGTLGYFLAPLDAIPDLTPLLGYTDDLGVLSFGLVTIAAYINDDVRIAARKVVKRMFKELDFEALQSVDMAL